MSQEIVTEVSDSCQLADLATESWSETCFRLVALNIKLSPFYFGSGEEITGTCYINVLLVGRGGSRRTLALRAAAENFLEEANIRCRDQQQATPFSAFMHLV